MSGRGKKAAANFPIYGLSAGLCLDFLGKQIEVGRSVDLEQVALEGEFHFITARSVLKSVSHDILIRLFATRRRVAARKSHPCYQRTGRRIEPARSRPTPLRLPAPPGFAAPFFST